MALIKYNDDSYTPGDFPEYTPPTPTRQSGKRGAGIVAVILGLIFLAGLAALFVYGPKYVTGLLNSGKQESAVVISAGQTATAMVADQFALAAPTEKVFQPEAETEEPVLPVETPVPSEPASAEPVIVDTVTTLPENTQVPSTEVPQTEVLPTEMPAVVLSTPVETETQPSIEQTPEAEPIAPELVPTASETVAQPEPTVDASAFMLTPVATETMQPTETVEAVMEPTQTETASPEPAETKEATPDPSVTILQEPTVTETTIVQTEEVVEPTPTATATTIVQTEEVVEPTATATATIAVEAEVAEATPTATVTELPDTGFADDIGLPFLALSSVLLLITIILSRKKRLS